MRGLEHVVVTPEHVEVRLRPAGPGPRTLALLLDTGIVLATSLTLARLGQALLPAAIGPAVLATLNFALSWGYHVVCETRYAGRSPGKRLLGLRVVDARGLPLTLGQSVVRNVVRALDALPVLYGVGALAVALDPLRRRLGDRAADTLVIQEGGAEASEPMTRRSAAWNSLDTPRVLRLLRRRLGPEERELILAVDRRAAALDPAARYDLMNEMAAAYRERLGIDDPHLPAEALLRGLAALLATPRLGDARGAGRRYPDTGAGSFGAPATGQGPGRSSNTPGYDPARPSSRRP